MRSRKTQPLNHNTELTIESQQRDSTIESQHTTPLFTLDKITPVNYDNTTRRRGTDYKQNHCYCL